MAFSASSIFLTLLLHHFVGDAFTMQTAKNELRKFVVGLVQSCSIFYRRKSESSVQFGERPPSILAFFFQKSCLLMEKTFKSFSVRIWCKCQQKTEIAFAEKWKTGKRNSIAMCLCMSFVWDCFSAFILDDCRLSGRESPLPLIVRMLVVYCDAIIASSTFVELSHLSVGIDLCRFYAFTFGAALCACCSTYVLSVCFGCRLGKWNWMRCIRIVTEK